MFRIKIDPTLDKRATDPLMGGKAEDTQSSKPEILAPHLGWLQLSEKEGLAEMR